MPTQLCFINYWGKNFFFFKFVFYPFPFSEIKYILGGHKVVTFDVLSIF